MSNPVFKPYNPHQLSLLPPSLEELIPANHSVRLVQQIVDGLNIDKIVDRYKGGGASSYHPRLLLKVLIYGYLSNIYSSRKLEEATRSNIHFMWLCGMQRPDHHTINRFRSEKLKGLLKEIFLEVVLLLAEEGLVSLNKVYVDGTKLEANANKYSFVWGKSIAYHKKRVVEQLQELWAYAEGVAAQEMQQNKPTVFEPINRQKVEQTISRINEALRDKQVDEQIKRKISYGQKHWPAKLDKYAAQEALLAGRNSYSKTDTDATFMRMKDDVMRNRLLKPGYNLQLSTEDQFIVNYGLYASATDTGTLIDHLEEFKALYGKAPEVVVADAGYGSEQNYAYLAQQQSMAFVKYPHFHAEQKHRGKANPRRPFHLDYLYYNAQEDYYVCPMGQRMDKQYQSTRTTQAGYIQHYTVYQAKNCQDCPLRGLCHDSQSHRKIYVNHHLRQLKAKARKLLTSDQGVEHRKQRCADVEAVFGQLKHNKGFRRFRLRGTHKVSIETGLLAIAHNLAKWAKIKAKLA